MHFKLLKGSSYQSQYFLGFLQQIIRIIVNISSNPNIIARTIIALIASSIAPTASAPIIIPITTPNATANIEAIIAKQFFFSLFLVSQQQFYSCGSIKVTSI